MMARRSALGAVAVCVLWTSALGAKFARFADTSTPVPGASGNLTGFSTPVYNGSSIVFQGFGTSARGIYRAGAGQVVRIADETMPRPEGGSNFDLAVHRGYAAVGGDTYFSSTLPNNTGIPLYRSSSGVLSLSVGSNVLLPSSDNSRSDPAIWAYLPSSDNVNLAFIGYTGFNQGIYTNWSGTWRPIADWLMAMPGSSQSFFHFGPPVMRDGKVAFQASAQSSLDAGIFSSDGTTLTLLAARGAPRPGGGSLSLSTNISFDGKSVAWIDRQSSQLGDQAIITNVGGTLRLVANANTPMPGGPGNFGSFGSAMVIGEQVLFLGSSQTSTPTDLGLFLWHDGAIMRFLGSGDMLDGAIVRSISFSINSGFGSEVATIVTFTNDSRALYLVTIPEPAAIMALLAVPIALSRRRGR